MVLEAGGRPFMVETFKSPFMIVERVLIYTCVEERLIVFWATRLMLPPEPPAV